MSTKKIVDVIDDVLAIVHQDRKHHSHMASNNSALKIERMERLDATPMLGDEDYFFLVGEDVNPSVMWPVNVGYVIKREDDGVWHFVNAKSAKPKDARGAVRVVSNTMLRYDIVEVNQLGQQLAATEWFSYLGSGKWVDATYHTSKVRPGYGGLMPAPSVSLDNTKCQLVISHALRQRYEWSVTIKEDGCPSILFGTNAEGVRELVKERDKGSGGRRDALKSWVMDHWRRLSKDETAEAYVRKHLRGGQKFEWRGYSCTWSPAEFDIEENERLRDERKRMGNTVRHVQ